MNRRPTAFYECNLRQRIVTIDPEDDKFKKIYFIYIDFRRAFDSVVHSKLIYKLHNIGIDGKLLCWIAEFLSERSLSVIIGESISNTVPVISGVPQGSVLAPLLFLVFINDLCDIFGPDIKIKLFADDAKIYMSIDKAALTF